VKLNNLDLCGQFNSFSTYSRVSFSCLRPLIHVQVRAYKQVLTCVKAGNSNSDLFTVVVNFPHLMLFYVFLLLFDRLKVDLMFSELV